MSSIVNDQELAKSFTYPPHALIVQIQEIESNEIFAKLLAVSKD